MPAGSGRVVLDHVNSASSLLNTDIHTPSQNTPDRMPDTKFKVKLLDQSVQELQLDASVSVFVAWQLDETCECRDGIC